jgi:Zn-finger nucleic acid-binding protein
MPVRDEEWLREARMRAQRGQWERDPEEIYRDLRAARAATMPLPAGGPPCPYCAEHPPMQKFWRYEVQTMDPLYCCPKCYGFWATGDSLARGVADPASAYHPALAQAMAPKRCRACHGRLKPEGTCRKCGESLPLLTCPACSKPMERFEKDGVTLDQCGPCRGTWFDVGEITAVYSIAPPQGLAASTVDEHATDDLPSGWMMALDIASRLAFPFLPIRLPF